MKASICIEMIFPDLSYEKRIERVASYGFPAVEFWSWRDKDLPRLKAAAESSGVEIANFSGQRVGDLIDRARQGEVLADFESALAAREVLGSPNLMILSQELGEGGAVVRKTAGEASADQIAAAAECVASLLDRMGKGNRTNLVLESLNTKLDHPGYAMSSVATAARVVKAVGDPRFGLLVDFYHQGMMGDDLPRIAREYAGLIKYVHVADVPGRHETGTGRVDWMAVLGALRDSGYSGFVGFEFSPARGSEEALFSLRAFWERFSSGGK